MWVTCLNKLLNKQELFHSPLPASSDVTPPSFTLNAEATPVSLEPWVALKHPNNLLLFLTDGFITQPSVLAFRRINIGQKYQAEIPDLQDEASSQSAQHKADLVWVPIDDAAFKHGDKETSKCPS